MTNITLAIELEKFIEWLEGEWLQEPLNFDTLRAIQAYIEKQKVDNHE